MPYTELLITEDLGNVICGADHLRHLLATGDSCGIRRFEGDLVELTYRLLEAGVVDPDHSLLNIIVLPAGGVGRLDFELARQRRWPRLHFKLFGLMVGRLILSYTFLVQPETALAAQFSKALVNRVAPSRRAMGYARKFVSKHLDIQRMTTGIDTRLEVIG
jgi:hypothetical protein